MTPSTCRNSSDATDILKAVAGFSGFFLVLALAPNIGQDSFVSGMLTTKAIDAKLAIGDHATFRTGIYRNYSLPFPTVIISRFGRDAAVTRITSNCYAVLGEYQTKEIQDQRPVDIKWYNSVIDCRPG